MEIKPSVYYTQVDRRQMQAWEMSFGGQGQRYLSAGDNVAPTGYVFYAVAFLSESVPTNLGYYGSYNFDAPSYLGVTFPTGFTWTTPLTSISLSAGNAVGYMYKLSTECCINDPLALNF